MQVVGKKAGAGALTAEMLKNPALMQALQGKLDGIIGTPSGYIEVRSYSLNEAHIPLYSTHQVMNAIAALTPLI